MTKASAATALAAPTYVIAGGLPADLAANIRVVDARSGDTITNVIEADADKGMVRRHEVVDGNLVREGDAFKVLEEKREIRIEWIDPPVALAADVAPLADGATA